MAWGNNQQGGGGQQQQQQQGQQHQSQPIDQNNQGQQQQQGGGGGNWNNQNQQNQGGGQGNYQGGGGRQQNRRRGKLTKVGAFWAGSNTNGQYFTGELTVGQDLQAGQTLRLILFHNKSTDNPKAPALDCMIDENDPFKRSRR